MGNLITMKYKHIQIAQFVGRATELIKDSHELNYKKSSVTPNEHV